jgi:hypothetical protein
MNRTHNFILRLVILALWLNTVPLHLEAREAVFIVFRQATTVASRQLARAINTTVGTISGAWEVSFPPNLGAPAQVKLENLASWTTQADDGIKHFSSTATYKLQAPPTWFRAGAKLWLDLGNVKDLAEVTLNGQSLGILWKPPYRVDVTGALRPGANRLAIKVTNQWTNRITGDRTLPEGHKILAGNGGLRFGGPAFPEAGLIGPVQVLAATKK